MQELARSRENDAATNRDWTKGNVFHNLLSLSWPIVLGNSLNLLGPVVDMIWVAKLGAAAIAGVGVASMAVMVVTSARMGLSMGTRAIIARFIGEGDTRGANHITQQYFVISSVYSILMAVIGIFSAKPIMSLFGLEADVVALSSTFIRIAVAGYLFMGLYFVMQNAIAGAGDTIPPMLISALNFWLIQIPLAFFLSRPSVFGVLGVRWAIVVGWVVGAAAYAIYFWKGGWKHKQV